VELVSEKHVVEAGDHVSRLADENGFGSYATIWDHPDNADLKAKRKNPNVLARGDEVAIPEKKTKQVQGEQGKENKFVVKVKGLDLRFKLADFLGRPIAGKSCKIEVEGDEKDVTSDGDGKVERPIPRSATTGSIQLADQAADFMIGFLEPADTDSGVRNRLVNLGYLDDPEDDDAAALAIEDFQIDQKLDVTGTIDDATRAKVVEVHGS
jgi:hypothetical protein